MRKVAVCPKDPSHATFVAHAVVTEEWLVNKYGDFQDVWDDSNNETVCKPDPQNGWTCSECNEKAVFHDEPSPKREPKPEVVT